MAANGGKLCESIFFTEREAILPAYFQESRGVASTSSSSIYYSARIHALMECKSKSGMSEEDAEIEASKAHWTETKFLSARSEFSDSSMVESSVPNCGEEQSSEEERVKLYEENVEVMQKLIEKSSRESFFQIGGNLWGMKIGEGGQAEIYYGWIQRSHDIEEVDEDYEYRYIWKVFKEGFSLREIQKQWPPALIHNVWDGVYDVYDVFPDTEENSPSTSNRFTEFERRWEGELENARGAFPGRFIEIGCVRLLEDGRLAFQMMRYLGDLRKFLDVRMEHSGNQHPPLMMGDGTYHESCMLRMMLHIAYGTGLLHRFGTLHRDLKASNILVTFVDWNNDPSKWEDIRQNLLEVEDTLEYVVADYECSLGVMGTGFWRAPEILEASKNRTLNSTPNLFTQKSDAYSYAMTCYEILTGFVPFENRVDQGTSIEDVIEGKRPTLPSHLKPWVEELLHKCWHKDPLVRPSFGEICAILSRKIVGV